MAIIFTNWKITEKNMNQAFERNAEKLGFIKGELYEMDEENVQYRLPNQKLPFLKKDFYVKNCYANFTIAGTEISIVLDEDEEFTIIFNHFRNIKGSFNKNKQIEIQENTLNEEENILYNENGEVIENILKKLVLIHENVYS